MTAYSNQLDYKMKKESSDTSLCSYSVSYAVSSIMREREWGGNQNVTFADLVTTDPKGNFEHNIELEAQFSRILMSGE